MERLSIQDEMITTSMGGVLPELSDPSSLQRVLDVGCGTGGWLMETAKSYPSIEMLIGADISNTMLAYARAFALVDRVDPMIRSNHEEDDPYFLALNLDRYHLTRSAALIAVGQDANALDELRLVKVGPEYPRRQACNDIYQAQAHFNLGEYDRVVELAESGLEVAQKIGSEVLIARVETIYQQLRESSYKDSPNVGRLDYLFRRRSKR